MDADVIVIGAGLAGLQCARRAQRSGHSVLILEAEDAVGGRVRTDRVDGFLCDRGFQLLNPAYPAVRQWIDVPALELQKFGVGVVVRKGQTATTLAHPIRHPRHALATLRSQLTPVSDVVAFARWMVPALLRHSTASTSARDEMLAASFDAAGFTGRLRRDVIDTFLAGVLADTSGESSANYVRQLMRFFAAGAPGLPRAGMQALPEQMAASLVKPVRLGTAARDLRETADGVKVMTDNGTIRARVAVVAVGAQNVAELTGLPTPVTRGLTTWWFRAPARPRSGPFLMVDATRPGGGPAGPIWHTAVVSEAAPSYAPGGENLVEATTLLDRPDGLAGEADVRRDLARLYLTSTDDWEVLVHHVVPHALPAQPPPLEAPGPKWMGRRILVAGDHRASGSIQGALHSGEQAARTVESVLAS
ncbi:flavin monoamine oxidase family protein [Arthrobacter sp. H14-L1]|uniref:flavin monoamine oxidase family protein n=1 Tax=Arthrobacter sp. H14-L1 TaxID=2996697 RepID=UPI002270062F|nr:FAD-dependent oxidoreductase [Arthrobacter sp. H14-L1]MCY0903427.1 FAD-dependent oxidoreductase [Arthrobacter sp. H14-L1]